MKKHQLLALILAVIVLAPVVAYLFIFGITITDNHTRWAEFGSAIGGIYSPLIALLTLSVLLRQVSLQAQMNTHELDQAYLQQARADIEFYSTQMAQTMDAVVIPGKTLRAFLHEYFLPSTAAELDSEQLREIALEVRIRAPSTFDMWAAIYPIFAGLQARKADMYDMTLASSTQKLLALLSFETCAALDNFHRALCEGRVNINYCFSPLLAKK